MRFFKYDPFAFRPRERSTVGALRSEAIGWDVEPHARNGAANGAPVQPVTLADFSPTA